eukprot:Pompholyxophrys_punicea_v1_NODE_28_length_5163_cov_5.731206.p10 type:complete len:125 gc:universal NODE_28_length_5163_cov_5.731206:719-345(-)
MAQIGLPLVIGPDPLLELLQGETIKLPFNDGDQLLVLVTHVVQNMGNCIQIGDRCLHGQQPAPQVFKIQEPLVWIFTSLENPIVELPFQKDLIRCLSCRIPITKLLPSKCCIPIWEVVGHCLLH